MTQKDPTATAAAGPQASTSRTKAKPATDRVLARPDGYYWVADDGEQEFGPFATAAQALAAANEAIETTVEEARALQDVEAEIGVAERLDHDIVEVDEQTVDGGGGGERN